MKRTAGKASARKLKTRRTVTFEDEVRTKDVALISDEEDVVLEFKYLANKIFGIEKGGLKITQKI